ncbi:MAG: methyltransferase domain-containing protein [Candidatus Sungbacteria bacterium]|nr:methyltransferase domain-containing protein [Candidatus Sungbacteria bacterium]
MKIYEPHYYEFADGRADWGSFPRRQILEFINRKLQPGMRLLELGCGTGELLSRLGTDINYVGVEISDFAVEEAKRRWRERVNAEFIMSGMVPFAENSFDAVCLIYVLEHVRQPRRFLLEALRVLKPGGTLVLAAPNLEMPLAYPHALRHRSFFYRLWFVVLRKWDYLLRVFGIFTFRTVTQNFVEATGTYEKKDDDLQYVVSSFEVVQFLKSNGVSLVQFFEEGEPLSFMRRLIQKLPAMHWYGKPLAAAFQKA